MDRLGQFWLFLKGFCPFLYRINNSWQKQKILSAERKIGEKTTKSETKYWICVEKEDGYKIKGILTWYEKVKNSMILWKNQPIKACEWVSVIFVDNMAVIIFWFVFEWMVYSTIVITLLISQGEKHGKEL